MLHRLDARARQVVVRQSALEPWVTASVVGLGATAKSYHVASDSQLSSTLVAAVYTTNGDASRSCHVPALPSCSTAGLVRSPSAAPCVSGGLSFPQPHRPDAGLRLTRGEHFVSRLLRVAPDVRHGRPVIDEDHQLRPGL